MIAGKRARSSDQKLVRRQEIVNAALALLEKKDYPQINVATVARLAKMAKGTFFLYFKTKEELFLAIAAEEFEKWFNSIDAFFIKIAKQKKPINQNAMLIKFQRILAQHTLLIRIMSILHIVLEHNISYAKALEFKRGLTLRVARTGPLMEQAMPFLHPGQGVQLVLWMYALVIGFAHLANPAPIIRTVYQNNPEIKKFQIDFGEQYFSAISTILDGWQAQNTLRPNRRIKSEVSHGH